MEARGLPGKREEPKRAGITASTFREIEFILSPGKMYTPGE